MVEAITPEQQKQAEENLALSEESAAQRTEQAAADAEKKAADAVNQANQKLARLPEEVIDSLSEAIGTLMKIINGWEDPSSSSTDPDSIISKLEALLDPVVGTLSGIISDIGLPEIPGLKQIGDLLAALKSTKPMDKPDGWTGPWPKDEKRPEIPQEMKRILQELLVAVQSLAITLPMVCINILFNTVDLILKTGIPVVGLNFYTIIGMVPYIKQIPDLVGLAPKIVDLVTNMSGKLGGAVEGKLKQMV